MIRLASIAAVLLLAGCSSAPTWFERAAQQCAAPLASGDVCASPEDHFACAAGTVGGIDTIVCRRVAP